ncbi:MAG: Ig-like domain-containing protein [Clostridia bacterium]|nr:Ig-like domain-containing protein [Clostridia bacterium]
MKKRISLRFISFLLSLVILLGGFPVSAVSLGTIDKTADASECLTEDISLRDKFTKHYTDTDGSRYAVVFPEQVHYQKNDEWLEVDNSLILDTKGERYVSENEIFKADFSKYSNDSQLVSIEEGGYKLSWSIAFASDNSSSAMSASANASAMRIDSRAAVLDSVEDIGLAKTRDNMTNMGKTMSSIRYNGVFNESVDIRYSVLHGKVEEDIILNSANAISSYILTVNTNGLNAVGGEDGSVRFIKADGETVFNLDAPWMTDAALAVSHDIAVEVVQKGSVAYIIYTPDAEWLNAESRLYPVLIDPSFTSRTYTSNYEDTYVYYGDYPGENADLTQLTVGTIEDMEHYAYIRILNIPEVFDSWEIENATLNVFTNSSSAPMLDLYIAAEDWTIEELSYDNQPLAYLIMPSVSVQTVYSRHGYSFDLTSELEEYYTLSDFCRYGFIFGCSESGYSQLYSSEYANSSLRPVFVIEYTYSPNECLEDGAVYSFKNVSSGKYMTVYGGGTAEGTNICQSGTTIPTLSETFRLEYDEDFECFIIRSLCSSNGYGSALTYSYSSMSSNPAGSTSGNVSLCSVDYEDSAWEDNQTWMILPQSGTNRFKIVSYRDPGLAVTSCGSAAGTSGGKTSSSSGNIFVSEFTGAANQLWKIESGGIQLNNAENIKTATTKDKKSEGANLGQFFCPVTEFGETVAWTTDNSNSAEVTSEGNVTTKKAGIANITATVTHTNGTTTAYSFKIHVVIQNGVYYFLNVETGYRIEYESPSDYSEGAVMEVYDSSDDDEEIPNYALFKIKYLGSGKYSIRSMLRNDMGWTSLTNDTNLVMTNIGTSDSEIPDEAKWFISYDTIDDNTGGYYIYNMYETRTIVASEESGDDIAFAYYSWTDLPKYWTLTRITDSIHGVTIRDKVNALKVGENTTFTAVMYSSYPTVNGQNGITWSVTDGTGHADIDPSTGVLTGRSTGTVTVRASYSMNYNTTRSATWQVYVYRPAVVLIHGRTDNSFMVWGANTRVKVDPHDPDNKDNNHYDPSLNARSLGSNDVCYTAWSTHELVPGFDEEWEIQINAVFNGKYTGDADEPYIYTHPEGGNLAYYLDTNGYTMNVDLFVFNYPNQDAVVHNANKLDAYLTSLTTHIREYGTDQQKLSFFGRTTNLTASSNYQIDIVGHSMGGLVARYYIENIGKDENVRRLITIDTPHWGSGLADTSSIIGLEHHLCDHDLRFDSCMYGGSFTTSLDCNALGDNCPKNNYVLTDELNYDIDRTTRYYAIAGLDYNSDAIDLNDMGFEINPSYTTFDDITEELQKNTNNKLYRIDITDAIIIDYIQIKEEGDNIVGFLSQIGCTESGINSPDKKIDFEKIFINIDTNGGNNISDHFHGKMAHRIIVINKVMEYLSE